MNAEHFRTFVWLRWRLFVNGLRRGGIANAIILGFLALFAVAFILGGFVASILVGIFAMPHASPAVHLIVWDGLIIGFFFCWCIGLLAELQRADHLSLNKFLHLPVSLSSAFLLNYLSSLVSLTMVLFLPAMVGFSLGMAIGVSPGMLLLLPLTLGFVLMVTALSYQFQGWLAALMTNKRRRRTVIVVATGAFILFFQLPNLINILRPWEKGEAKELNKNLTEETARLQDALLKGEITPTQHQERLAEATRNHNLQREANEQQMWQRAVDITSLVNLIVPPGWLALGAKHLADGNVLPALLGTIGFGLIGTASLWRSYRTTLRLYTGQFTAGKQAPAKAAAPVRVGPPAKLLLEKRLPWLSEPATAVTLGSLQALMRAPEAKMLLLAPVIIVLVFGSIFAANDFQIPEIARPLLPFGISATILLTLVQVLGNQFGFERNGFRVFVLCPASRRDILLGKNLAIAPFAFLLCLMMTIAIQIIQPMGVDYLLATIPQWISMFLLFCLLANWLSILAPMRIAQGSLKASNVKLLPIALQFVFMFLYPFVMLPTLLPYGLQALLEWQEVVDGVPICPALSLLECVGIVFLYRLVLQWQGNLLSAREQQILDIVVTKVE